LPCTDDLEKHGASIPGAPADRAAVAIKRRQVLQSSWNAWQRREVMAWPMSPPVKTFVNGRGQETSQTWRVRFC